MTKTSAVQACDCAERTGELVFFTCPVCCEKALLSMRVLTSSPVEIRLDRSGSVSALIGSGGL